MSNRKFRAFLKNGLSKNVDEAALKEFFQQFGKVTDVYIPRDAKTREPKGFGFVSFDSEEALKKATKSHSLEINGNTVSIALAEPRPSDKIQTQSTANNSSPPNRNPRKNPRSSGLGNLAVPSQPYPSNNSHPPFISLHPNLPSSHISPFEGKASLDGNGYPFEANLPLRELTPLPSASILPPNIPPNVNHNLSNGSSNANNIPLNSSHSIPPNVLHNLPHNVPPNVLHNVASNLPHAPPNHLHGSAPLLLPLHSHGPIDSREYMPDRRLSMPPVPVPNKPPVRNFHLPFIEKDIPFPPAPFPDDPLFEGGLRPGGFYDRGRDEDRSGRAGRGGRMGRGHGELMARGGVMVLDRGLMRGEMRDYDLGMGFELEMGRGIPMNQGVGIPMGRGLGMNGVGVERGRPVGMEDSLENRIFVGGVPDKLESNDIKVHFEKYGKVEDIYFPRDKATGRRRNFCYVRFASKKIAEIACARSPRTINGLNIGEIKIANPRPNFEIRGNEPFYPHPENLFPENFELPLESFPPFHDAIAPEITRKKFFGAERNVPDRNHPRFRPY